MSLMFYVVTVPKLDCRSYIECLKQSSLVVIECNQESVVRVRGRHHTSKVIQSNNIEWSTSYSSALCAKCWQMQGATNDRIC